MLYGHNPDEDHDLALDESHASLGALDESHASFGEPWTGWQVTNETRRGLAEEEEKERWDPVGSGVGGPPCSRMRMYLTYSAEPDVDLLSVASLRDMLKADKMVTAHTKYDRWCAKWVSSLTGEVRSTKYCPPRHLTQLISSFLDCNGIL